MELAYKLAKQADDRNKFIAKLKDESPVYPDILFKEVGDELYLSSKVRIIRDGKYYLVHCVESANMKMTGLAKVTIEYVFKRFSASVYFIQLFYNLTNGVYEDLDINQQSEYERFKIQ